MNPVTEIHSIDAPELAFYANLSEKQLYHYFEPAPGIFLAESPNVIERALAAGYEPLSVLAETTDRPRRRDSLRVRQSAGLYGS